LKTVLSLQKTTRAKAGTKALAAHPMGTGGSSFLDENKIHS
jgi:hypothetical protein